MSAAISRDGEIMSIDQLLQAREERDFLLNHLSKLECSKCPCDGLYPDIDNCLDAVKQWMADEIKKGWKWGE